MWCWSFFLNSPALSPPVYRSLTSTPSPAGRATPCLYLRGWGCRCHLWMWQPVCLCYGTELQWETITSQDAFWNIFGQWVLSGEGHLRVASTVCCPRAAFTRCQFTLLQSQVPTIHAASCQATPISHTFLPGHREVLVVAKVS